MKIENHLGTIDVSNEYMINLVGNAVVNCYGVAAMSYTDAKQGLLAKLRKSDSIDKGIRIRTKNQKLMIDIHIIVTYGTNISAIVKSIMHKVEFTVTDKTGFEVYKVNVFVDGMQTK